MQLMKAAGIGKAPASPAAGPADGPTVPVDLFKVCPDRLPSGRDGECSELTGCANCALHSAAMLAARKFSHVPLQEPSRPKNAFSSVIQRLEQAYVVGCRLHDQHR